MNFSTVRFSGIAVTQNDIVPVIVIGKQASGLKPDPLVVESDSPRMQQPILRKKENVSVVGMSLFLRDSKSLDLSYSIMLNPISGKGLNGLVNKKYSSSFMIK